jgi:predicted permease
MESNSKRSMGQMKRDPTPPRFFQKILRWFCDPGMHRAIEGDLIELYDERIKQKGKRSADVRFALDVLLLFRPSIIRKFGTRNPTNNYGMIRSYAIIGWRNLMKGKVYSFINIGGLAIGMAAATLIGLWLHSELSYNTSFTNYDRIAWVMKTETFNDKTFTTYNEPMQLAPELRNKYGANFKHVVMNSGTGDRKLTYNNVNVVVTGNFMEPGVTDMFDLEMLEGTRSGLKDMNSIMLSASAAQSLFGREIALGKQLKVDDNLDVIVTGVYKDIPETTEFESIRCIMPWQLLVVSGNFEGRVGWGNNWFTILAQVEDGVDMEAASADIKYAKRDGAGKDESLTNPVNFLHPMNKWRLYSKFENGVNVGGQIRYVWMFGMIGAFVLLLACINFMNLSTARSERRAKEVGIRKAVGSRRFELIKQFYTESFMLVGIALILSLVLVQVILPWFNAVADKRLSIMWTSAWFWTLTIGFTIVIGILSGSYPALHLSSFVPVKVLKGLKATSRFSIMPRQIMVVVQFSVSITFIIGTFVVLRQIDHAQSRPIGYDNTGIITSPIKSGEIKEHFDSFMNELKATGAVEAVSLSDNQVTNTGTTNSGFFWQGKPDDMQDEFATLRVTEEFGDVVKWEVVDGRDFSISQADTASFIINETAAKYMGLAAPVGENVRWGRNGSYKIIGVVKDMVTQSPYMPVKPMIYVIEPKSRFISLVMMRVNTEMSSVESVTKIESVFNKFDPKNEFTFRFAEDEYNKKFNSERRIANLSSGLTGLAVIICCLGLFGLASFITEQRTKEIGIRKVLGASAGNIWRIISIDFITLVIIAGVISIVPAWLIADDWLSQYQYRAPLSWTIFFAAISGAIAIALLTVSYHALRSAVSNPVHALRSE